MSAEHPALARYAAVGRAMAGENLPDSAAIDAAAVICADLAKDLLIPPLRRFGMSQNDVPAMVALAKKASSMRFNPVELPDEVLGDVLKNAIGVKEGDCSCS